MRAIEKTFRKDGFDYEQVFRQGDIAIYKQTKKESPANIHFEVGIIQKNKEREMFGVKMEANESWPPSTAWGILAWTYGDLASAKRRAMSLLPPNA